MVAAVVAVEVEVLAVELVRAVAEAFLVEGSQRVSSVACLAYLVEAPGVRKADAADSVVAAVLAEASQEEVEA